MSGSPQDADREYPDEGAWRRPSLAVVGRLTAIVSTIWVATILIAKPELLRSYFAITIIVMLAAVWVSSFGTFSDRIRFAVMQATCFVASAAGIMAYGSNPAVAALLCISVLLAAIYFDWKGGLKAGAASLLLIAAGAWGWTSGILPIGPKLQQLSLTHRDYWVRLGFAQLLVICTVTALIASIVREMRAALGRSRMAEEKFSKAFSACPDPMVVTELDSGCIIEVNDSCLRAVGYSRKEVLGRTTLELGVFRSTQAREVYAGALREKGAVHQMEFQIIHRDGHPIDVMFSAECFELAGRRCVLTIIQDVTERNRSAAALRDSEQRIRSFIENATAGIYRSTPAGQIIMANPALVRLMGYDSLEQLAQRNLEKEGYEPTYSRKDFRESIERTGYLRGWETAWKKRDGSTIFVRESANVIRGEDGKVLYYDGIIEDVSEQKKAEQALRESEERYRNLTAAAFEGVVISENGKIVDINNQGLELFGCTRDEIIGRDVLDFVGPESRSAVGDRIRTRREGNFEHKLLRKDGTAFHAEAKTKIMHVGSRLVRMTALRDITERRQAEQQLRESEERFRNLTSAAFEGIVITDAGRVVDINEQGLKLFGREHGEMFGHDVMEFVSPVSRSMVLENMRNQCELAYEHQLLRKDGSSFYAEAKAKMMHLGGRLVRITALLDITERRQAEQRQKNLEEQLRQTQKMEALGTLAGGIAHDFNNILTGILGNLQLAEMDLPSGHPAYIAVKAADKASWRARDLIARILSFSRIQRDNRAPAALDPVVLEAVQLLKVGLPGEIEIRTDIDKDCPMVVFDAGQVHQIIMNLGTNSAHAMRGSRGVLEVELHSVTPSSDLCERYPQVNSSHRVCLTIRDNGTGMSEDVRKRIFEPFYTTKALGQGTGLGLAMVHAIMKSHNGAIIVESEPGAGTTFDLYFSAADDNARALKPSTRHPFQGELVAFGNGRRILLVDDEAAICEIGTELLDRLGFLPSAFVRPAEALEAFRAEPACFCAVICDLTMPEMTGLELARQILAIRPGIPFILTSGYLHSDAQQRARESGVRSVINKPFQVQEMIDQIRAVLGE